MIYIAGKMRGLPDLGWAKFKEAEDYLDSRGAEYFSPRKADEESGIDPQEFNQKSEGQQAIESMSLFQNSLMNMLQDCDRILLLDNWRESKGATLEADIACALGWRVMEFTQREGGCELRAMGTDEAKIAVAAARAAQASKVLKGEPQDIEAEARSLIGGDRRDSYGDWSDEANKVAAVWSGITGTIVEPRHVALMMVGLKLVREGHKPKRDNLVDIVGYTLLQEGIK